MSNKRNRAMRVWCWMLDPFIEPSMLSLAYTSSVIPCSFLSSYSIFALHSEWTRRATLWYTSDVGVSVVFVV